MTSLPAAVFDMTDRGVIRPGAFADLVIFDPAAIRDMATYAEPQQLAVGISYVFVDGLAVLADGKFTDAAQGRVLTPVAEAQRLPGFCRIELVGARAIGLLV